MQDKTLKKAFVIMPFNVKEHDQPKYNDLNHWNEVYEGLISPAITSAKMQCERDDKDIGSRLIAVNILRKIEEADLILCDLSSFNPNVFLELGWALRGNKPYVLIKDDLTNYTFDLNQQYIFDYSHLLKPSTLRKEIEKLTKVIEQTVGDQERRYSLTNQISYSLSAIKAAQEDPNTRLLLDIQQRIHGLEGRLGNRYMRSIDPKVIKFISIAKSMLESNEKIEQQLFGNYLLESSSDTYEIVKGLFAATNHRVIVVRNSDALKIRKDRFTYPQINSASMTQDKESLSLIIADEVITLYDLSDVDPYQDPEKFYKYILEKKMTTVARDVEISPPPKK